MNRTEQNPEALLDSAINAVRDERLDDRIVEESGRRVWARIVAAAAAEEPAAPAPHLEPLESCADFQALFDEYRAGTLNPARRMLVEDHLHECVACRKVLHPVTVRMTPAAVIEMPKPRWRPMRWAAAAAIVAFTGFASYGVWELIQPPPSGSRMTLTAADGPVYRLKGGLVEPVSVGAEFEGRDRLRTGGGGHAIVRLIDGSSMEVGERAELSVGVGRRDTTVYLDRGQVIVQAAKRKRGRLYVASGDSMVAVKGTIFSVNRGFKGSRVSVVEGSVEVRYRGNREMLAPGDQITTDRSMGRTAITDEISWSRNFDQYLALLKQLVDMKEKLDEIHVATLRYGSRLLDAAPQGTTVFVSIPNLGRAIADVERIVKEQGRQNPQLRQHLEQHMPEFEKLTTTLSQIGEYLGEEIIIAFQECKGFCGVFVAEVHRPGLREFIEKQAGGDLRDLKMEFVGNRVIVGENPELIAAAARGNSGFTQTPFGQTIADAYRRGVGILVSADLEKIVGAHGTPPQEFVDMGIDQVRHLVAEQRELNGRTEYSAVVNFKGARRGIASWLAEPGAMGSLSFVSPSAQFAASFVVKDPAQMLQDLVQLTGGFTGFERETGIRVDELAGALGGEITIALDGPMIPVPSWKAIVEVKDPAKVQAAIQTLVARANDELRRHGNQQVELTQSTQENLEHTPLKGTFVASSDTTYAIRGPGALLTEAHYRFVDGYMVLAPNDAVLDKAVSDRRGGVTLARSGHFRRLLPGDSRAHFSGMVYQNAGELLRLVGQGAAAMATTEEQQKQAAELAEKLEPMLMTIYGGQDRIELASQGSTLNLLTQAMAGRMLHMETDGKRSNKRTIDKLVPYR